MATDTHTHTQIISNFETTNHWIKHISTERKATDIDHKLCSWTAFEQFRKKCHHFICPLTLLCNFNYDNYYPLSSSLFILTFHINLSFETKANKKISDFIRQNITDCLDGQTIYLSDDFCSRHIFKWINVYQKSQMPRTLQS